MLRWLFVVLLAGTTLSAAAADPALPGNSLARHPSPYLAMHGDDPVHWQPWNRQTLLLAKRLDRPLLVSIGYFSCHWCHVMQRESYQDAAVAALMNQGFVPVKVDRELDPALDAHLIEFVQMTRGQAGWPLNVILTPDGYPLLGFVYLPKPQFSSLLENFRERWQSDPESLRELALAAMQEWRDLRGAAPAEAPRPRQVMARFLQQAGEYRDELSGGFGQQSKFPMVPQLQALLRALRDRPDRDSEAFLRLTLERMASQGLRDLVGGGFFRYTTDPDWRTPHYEKMLYDNAQLALLYFQAAAQFDDAGYRRVAIDTLDFMLDAMQRPDGAFISSFSAVDDAGREGYYYLWERDSLQRLLQPKQRQAVLAAWFGSGASESEYGDLPRWQGSPEAIATRLGWSAEVLLQTLESARARLLEQRQRRVLPADRKALASWNGLALSALAAGFAATENPRYRDAGARLYTYLVDQLMRDDGLVRARDGARVLSPASLEDYALLAQGLYDWSLRQPAAADQAEQLVRTAWRRYYSDARWLMDDAPLIPMLEGRVALEDSPLPSASALVTRLSLELSGLEKDAALQRDLQSHLREVGAYLGDSLFWYASYAELLAGAQPLE